MTYPTDNARRRAAVPLLLTVALGIGGCANMTFPELPEGVMRPTAEAEPEEAAEDAAPEAQVAETMEPPQEPEDTKPARLYEWNGDGRDVTRVVIDTNAQMARFYSGEDELGWTTIASGVAKHPTPRGEFAVLEKVRDKRSNLYGRIVNRNGKTIRGNAHGSDPVPRGARFLGASMPNFMRLTYDGIGMHAGPIPNPGQPASHGCIRMPPEMASAVFEHVANGTRVTVVGNGPDYGNYAERIARQRAEAEARRAAAAAAAEGTALDALDAEIEVLERAGVGDNTDDEETQAQAEPSQPQRAAAEIEAETDSADRSGSQDRGQDNAETEGVVEHSGEARADADADARPPVNAGNAAAETRSSDTQSGADSGSSAGGATPTAQRPSASERASAPKDFEDSPQQPAPAAPSGDDISAPPAYYGPPEPPPTIRSARAGMPSPAS